MKKINLISLLASIFLFSACTFPWSEGLEVSSLAFDVYEAGESEDLTGFQVLVYPDYVDRTLKVDYLSHLEGVKNESDNTGVVAGEFFDTFELVVEFVDEAYADASVGGVSSEVSAINDGVMVHFSFEEGDVHNFHYNDDVDFDGKDVVDRFYNELKDLFSENVY